MQRWARLRRPEDWPPYNIHKTKPRPGNVFHIAGAGLFKALGHEPILQVFEEAFALLIVLVLQAVLKCLQGFALGAV